jgi:hypothetical protein
MEKVPGVSAIEWKKIRKAARNACNRFAKDSKPVLLSEPPASAAASAATGKTAVPATAETIAEASVAATIPEHSKAALFMRIGKRFAISSYAKKTLCAIRASLSAEPVFLLVLLFLTIVVNKNGIRLHSLNENTPNGRFV